MHEDTVVAFRQPGSFSDDPLTDVLRAGARQLLGQAIEAEVEAHIAAHADLTDAKGRRRVVRHGYLPEREIQTGIGAVRVKAPRVRDRDPAMTGGRIGFTSSILPPYLRRSQSMEALLPWLYLKGISSGDFSEALVALLGPDALLEPLGSGCCKPKRENDTMGNNIRSSSRPKALAPSIPMPPLADAMDAVHLSVDRFCLLAGVEALAEMMEEDATTVCGARHREVIAGAGHIARSATTAA